VFEQVAQFVVAVVVVALTWQQSVVSKGPGVE
jgi:hypothetical protein